MRCFCGAFMSLLIGKREKGAEHSLAWGFPVYDNFDNLVA